MFRECLIPFLIGLALLIPGASFASTFDESIGGDLSNDPDAPTPLAFDLGSNVLSGELDGLDDVGDYLTFTITDGQSLASLLLLEYMDGVLPIPANTGFHAINAGATSFIPSSSTASSFLGGNHLDARPPSTDLLPSLATTPIAGTGFDIPLAPGTYSYLIQQINPSPTRYSLEFVLVPEPSTGMLVLIGLALMRCGSRPATSRREI